MDSFNFSRTPEKPRIIPLNSTQTAVVNTFLQQVTLSGAGDLGSMIANTTGDPMLLDAFNNDSNSSDNLNGTNVSIAIGYRMVDGNVIPINVSDPSAWFAT